MTHPSTSDALDAPALERLAGAPGVLACDRDRLVIRTSDAFRLSHSARAWCVVGALVVPPLLLAAAWRWLIGPAWLPAAGIGLAGGCGLAYMLLVDLRLVALRGADGVVLERFNVLTHRKSRVLVLPRDEVDGHHVEEALSGPAPFAWVMSELRLLRGDVAVSVWEFPEHELADLAGRHLVDLMRRPATR